MKKRVLYFSPQPSDSTAHWRTSGVLPYLSSNEFHLIDISYTTHFTDATFINADVLIMQRPFAREHATVMGMAKAAGLKIVSDYDDDLTCVPETSPVHGLYVANQVSLRDCILLSDELWVSTPSIGESFGHPNTVVVPNAHNEYLFKVGERRKYNRETKRAIYRGGQSHQADVYSMADELVKVVNANPDWTFSVIGDRFTYLEQRCGDNYHIVGGMSLMAYFKYYFEQNSNVAIFPLVDCMFNRGKSNIAMLESAYAGSAFFGNTDLPEFNHAFISDIKHLPGLIHDKTMQQRNSLWMWEWVVENRLLSQTNKLREESILRQLK